MGLINKTSIMKKIMLAMLLLSGLVASSQGSGFGIKGGLNYGDIGDLQVSTEFATSTFSKENKTGYHAGIFYKAEFAGIFIQPEVLYTKLNTEYTGDAFVSNASENYEFSKLDIPLLIGFDILGPLNVKAGPSFQYILDSGFEDLDIDFEDPENSFTVGYQLGIGITIGQLGFDVRYEGAFQENTIVSDTSIQDAGFTVDSRPAQWILSLSYSLDRNN